MFKLKQAVQDVADATETLPYEASRIGDAFEEIAEAARTVAAVLVVCGVAITACYIVRTIFPES